MEKLYKTFINMRMLMLVLLTSFFAFNAQAQTISVAPGNFPTDRAFVGERDTVRVDTAGDFSNAAVFYLFRQPSNSTPGTINFTQDDIVDSGSDTLLTPRWSLADVLDGGSYDYWVAVSSNFGTASTVDIGTDQVSIPGQTLSGGSYSMNGAGFRTLTTDPISELNTTETVILSFDIDFSDVSPDDSLVVEFSTDGNTWLALEDDAFDSAAFANDYAGGDDVTLNFTLPAAAKDADTRFRIDQPGRSDFEINEDSWFVNASSISLQIGSESFTDEVLVLNNFDVERPATSIADVLDSAGTTIGGDLVAGQPIELDARFLGFEDQVSDYNYTAIFRNGEQSFRLDDEDVGSITSTDNADGSFTSNFSITGDVPNDLEYDETWSVTIEAYTGSTPTLGFVDDFIPVTRNQELFTIEGGSLDPNGGTVDYVDFDGDLDRQLTTEPFDIQSVANATISVELDKLNDGVLASAGTEIVLEYSTDGSTFTQIGDAISLNDTIDNGPFEFDVSSVTGLVSSSTQLRVRQLSNNGQGLDAWRLETFSFSADGDILFDKFPVDYQGENRDIVAPTIALDAVDVPSDLIFPGDEVELTYNIFPGSFPANTMVMAVIEVTGVSDPGLGGTKTITYNVGSSTEITPGQDQDNTITITIPAIVGDNYDIKLITTSGAESNSVTLPVFDTQLEITELSSDNGVTDQGVDIIYPGDQVTATYTIDGSVGTGAELFFEVLDYGDLQDDPSDNVFVVINSATGADIDGDISGALPTNINFDDFGTGDDPTVRIRIGNGLLATSSLEVISNEDGFDYNGTSINNSNLFDAFDEESITGNDPTNSEAFIASGERSIQTKPVSLPFGGEIQWWFNTESFDFNQDVTLSASNDGGATFTVIAEDELEGGLLKVLDDDYVQLPAELWGDEVIFKFAYNEDGEAAEFENELSVNNIVINGYTFDVGNSDEFDFSGQFRRPRVTLEDISGDNSYTVGEEITIEYTTEGTFPDNTEFALIFTGVLDNGDDFGAVVATSATQGAGSFTFNVPDYAFEEDGSDNTLDLFDQVEVVAYDATGGVDFQLDDEEDIDDNDQFLVIEGISQTDLDNDDGEFTFDRKGNRSILTEAFDLTGAQSVTLEFTFDPDPLNDSDVIDPMDNILTIPQLQVSIDAGATFQNVSVDEEDLLGAGYLFEDNTYEVEIPAEFVTAATHFRWYQALNLGEGADDWNVNSIKLIFDNGNEIETFYEIGDNEQPITVNHPDLNNFEFSQVDNNDAIFSGETVEFAFDALFETTPRFPEGTRYNFALYDGSEYVIDPTSKEPFILGSTEALGSFTATIPNYVENGSYQVHLFATTDADPEITEEELYFYAGSPDLGANVGTVDVFLRVAKTTLDFDPNDVLYAGSTVTFNVTLENAETFGENEDNLFSNLVIPDFDGTGEDLLVTSEAGIVSSFTVDLPPFVRETESFEVRFSQGSALSEDLTIIGQSDLMNLEDELGKNFINGQFPDENYYTYYIGNEDDQNIRAFNGNFVLIFDYENNLDDDLRARVQSFDPASGYVNIGEIDLLPGTSGTVNLNVDEDDFFDGQNFLIEIFGLGSPDVGSVSISNLSYQDGADASPSVNLDENDFISDGFSFVNKSPEEVEFSNDLGRGLITTRDFEADELEDATLLEFTLGFDEVPENMLENQFLILEYSIDEGATYTQLDSYPDPDEEDPLDNEEIVVALNDEIRSNDTRFRWRQEERASIVAGISDISISKGLELKFDYQAAEDVEIVPQQLLVSSVSAEESCLADAFTLGFEVRGRMGANNIVGVEYSEVGSASFTPLAEQFNAFEGTGTIDISLPGDLVSDTDNNRTYEFRLVYDDETFADLDPEFNNVDPTYEGDGPVSDENIEIVAPANPNTPFSFSNPTLCANEDVEVTITDTQQYFMYEVLDAAGTVLGSTVFDPDVNGSNKVNIGTITEATDLSVRVTAMSESGALTCNSVVSKNGNGGDNRLEPLADYELYGNNGGANGSYSLVQPGAAITVCEAGSGAILDVRRLRADGGVDDDDTIVEWFVDDVNNPVVESDSLAIENVDRSGAYFARVTDGSCVYTTESIQIDVEETPAQPSITVVSGDLEACSGSDPVVLEAPEGFAYYQWGTPQGTVRARTVEADTTGNYFVQVSNIPFDVGCASDTSASVTVVRYDLPELSIADNIAADGAGGFITEGAVFDECEEFTVFFYDDESNGIPDGTIEIIRDGASVGFEENVDEITLEESGTYSFTWTNDDNANIDCSVSTVSFTLNIVETPDRVEITSTGDLAFCEGEGSVTLTAPEGFAEYVWLRSEDGDTFDPINTTDPDFEAVSANTIEVSTGGFYAVEVANLNGCNSAISNVIEVSQRATPPLPEVSPGFGLSVTQEESVCGSGAVTFAIAETEADYQYQLLDASTGQPSGDAVRGAESGDMFITSAAIEENTRFYLEISYADGTGCTEQYPDNTFEGSVNNVILEMEGNTIVAEISGSEEEITWFRNDVELRNRADLKSISVIDAATYSVEVDFGNGCVITSNAVTLEASAEEMQTFFGELEVTSYPNPTTDDLKIDLVGGDLGDYTITLMNMSGQVVMSKAVTKSDDDMTEVLDLSAVEKGVYNLRIQRGNTVENVRIVKQ